MQVHSDYFHLLESISLERSGIDLISLLVNPYSNVHIYCRVYGQI